MRWASARTSIILAFVAGTMFGIAASPLWKLAVMKLGQSEYAELTFRCDTAMRGHLLAKQKLVGTPSEENAQNLKAAEIGLLDCQYYDLLRKKLIRWGLTDNELSEMGLLAIEQKGQDLRDVVNYHEIRY